MDKKVSIIIPSYKRGREFFARAIESLLAQSYANIEIVVIDDNAKPEHMQFRKSLQEYVEELKNDKIVYIQNQENLGGALSRNEGIKRATGEYIAFLDDDDRYLPDKIKNQLEFMLENDLEMCFGDVALYNEKDVLIDYRNHSDLKEFGQEYLLKYHLTKQIAGTISFMATKALLDKIGGFDPAIMGQEYYLMYKIIMANPKIGYYPKCDSVAYRTAAEAISTGKNKILGEKALYKFKKTHFKHLSLWQRSYVRCRHYAVMAVAYKRNKMFGKMIGALFMSVLCNPLLVFAEGFSFIKRRFKRSKWIWLYMIKL